MSMGLGPHNEGTLVAGLVHGLGTGFGVHFCGHRNNAVLHKGVGHFAVLKGLLAGFLKGGPSVLLSETQHPPGTSGRSVPQNFRLARMRLITSTVFGPTVMAFLVK